MDKHLVSIVAYEKPFESVNRAVELARGLEHLPQNAKVFIKPNIVFWTKAVAFPKWGVITTSRVVADTVRLLKEHGVSEIVIGEGVVVSDPKDTQTAAHAFQSLGYRELEKRFGVKIVNVMDGPFTKVDIGQGVYLHFSSHIMEADFVVDLPVMKTHNQTMVSLGIKNLKGTINIASRKKCHGADPVKDLHWHVARLADSMPPMLTLIDGIYTLERGPAFDGKIHRSNVLVASADVFSADLVGTRILGMNPADVPHLVHAGKNRGRPLDLSDVEVAGKSIESVACVHEYDFPYRSDENGEMPVPLAKQGIKGLFYRKFDTTMCTYCSGLNGLLLTAIRSAYKGEPWEGIEVLTGKKMQPTPGMEKTILLGQCMVKAHRKNPNIKNLFAITGCPPKVDEIVKALHGAGIDADPNLFASMDQLPGFFMARYQGKPEYDESFFKVE